MKSTRSLARPPVHGLSPEAQAQLAAFKGFAVTHPLLEDSGSALTNAIREPAGFAHILLFGPTGVGKTTVLTHVTKELIPLLLTERSSQSVAKFGIERDRSLLQGLPTHPLLLLEARIPDGGTFDRADYYRTALRQLGEPFYGEYRVMDLNDGQTWETKTRSRGRTTPFNDAHHLRRALEEAAARKGVQAVIIDEAQHLMKVAAGAKLLDQLEWLKSMSNTMGVVHVLVGTYDLLDLRNLSSQSARRGHDIHFPRYQFQHEADQIAFQRALRGLLEHMPLKYDLQDLMNHWPYFYERSIGCIGVLKDWLVRTLSDALRRGTDQLTLDRLQRYVLSNAQCERMAADATAAEQRLHYTESSRERLWSLLGMSMLPAGQTMLPAQEPAHAAPRSHPGVERLSSPSRLPSVGVGQRAPTRDPVGTGEPVEKPKKCSFSGVADLSPAQLQQAGIAKLQCPECSATWAARIRGDTVLFPPHPPRTTRMTQDISRWIKQETGWTLYTRGE